jgi:hypothetical protein
MNKLFLVLAFFSTAAFGTTPYGRIVDIKGGGFISRDGKTQEIKKGDLLYPNSEIVIEHAGQVTFTDNADHRFHMGNSSSVAIFANHIELRSGDVWFQSINKVDDYKVMTANAAVNYQGGEAIVSYDSIKGKTQVMVINGLMKLSNLLSPALNLSVAEGSFSFVDNKYEEGMPRDPTPVGEKTYGKLISLFHGIAPMDKNSVAIFKENDKDETHAKVTRGIASVVAHADESKELEAYKESLLKTNEVKTAAVKKTPKTAKVVKKLVEEKLVIQIYGQRMEPVITSPSRTRAPASVPELVIDQAVSPELNLNETTDHLQNTEQYKESDKLINQLNQL